MALKFFEYAAFYGGTALRALYGLNRFSDDLDFSLLITNKTFDMAPHLTAIKDELESFGFEIKVESKSKKVDSNVESAFLKAGTKIQFLNLRVPTDIAKQVPHNETLKIKFEVDTDPPSDFSVEMKNLMSPIPFQVKTMTLDCLFAGKLHAVLARKWKTRIKGRDFYDLLWYLGQKVEPNLLHLKSRLVQSENWNVKDEFSKADLGRLLTKKIKETNFLDAKNDVAPFIKARELASLDLWNKEYFLEVCSPLFG